MKEKITHLLWNKASQFFYRGRPPKSILDEDLLVFYGKRSSGLLSRKTFWKKDNPFWSSWKKVLSSSVEKKNILLINVRRPYDPPKKKEEDLFVFYWRSHSWVLYKKTSCSSRKGREVRSSIQKRCLVVWRRKPAAFLMENTDNSNPVKVDFPLFYIRIRSYVSSRRIPFIPLWSCFWRQILWVSKEENYLVSHITSVIYLLFSNSFYLPLRFF